MRIVSGRTRGRKLFSPPGTTRPTTDRVREALFNSLDNLLDWDATTVLDLYAGSGAVGLEAASRGAQAVTLVEKNATAVATAERNRRVVGAPGVTIVRRSVQAFLATAPTTEILPSRPHVERGLAVARESSTADAARTSVAAPYDLVFADPPYAQVEKDWPGILTALVENGWVADGSVIVLERSSRDTPTHWPAHYREYRSKKYGETRIDIAIVESTGNLAA